MQVEKTINNYYSITINQNADTMPADNTEYQLDNISLMLLQALKHMSSSNKLKVLDYMIELSEKGRS